MWKTVEKCVLVLNNRIIQKYEMWMWKTFLKFRIELWKTITYNDFTLGMCYVTNRFLLQRSLVKSTKEII